MTELKVSIVKYAIELMDMLDHCEDEDFVDLVVNSIYENDVAPLWDIEDTPMWDVEDEM